MKTLLTDEEIYTSAVDFAHSKRLLRNEFDDETLIEFVRGLEKKILEKIGEPVAYVEGIPNLDGSSCHMDQYMPAGTALYIIDFKEGTK